jgi:3-dehydroquinate dehydratase
MSKKKMVTVSATELKRMQSKINAEERKKAKRLERKVDGMGPHLVSQIRSALRQVWQRSEARKLAVKRVTLEGGYFRCESKTCKDKKYPKVYIDHIKNVGELDAGFLDRLFISSHGLQALCKGCHDAKTRAERKKK